MALKLSAAMNFLLQGLHMYLESPSLSVIGRSSTLLSLPGISALCDSLENSATETIGATALLQSLQESFCKEAIPAGTIFWIQRLTNVVVLYSLVLHAKYGRITDDCNAHAYNETYNEYQAYFSTRCKRKKSAWERG